MKIKKLLQISALLLISTQIVQALAVPLTSFIEGGVDKGAVVATYTLEGTTASFSTDTSFSAPTGKNWNGNRNFKNIMVFRLPQLAAGSAWNGTIASLTFKQEASTVSAANLLHGTRVLGLYDTAQDFTPTLNGFNEVSTVGTAIGAWFSNVAPVANGVVNDESVPTATINALAGALTAGGYDSTAEKYLVLGIYATGTPDNNEYLAMSKTNVVLNLNVVPEPSTYALIGGLLALGFVFLKRRRSC